MKRDQRLKYLVDAIDKIANEHFDGHFAIFGFTTHVKGCWGTPGDMSESLSEMIPHGSIESLLEGMTNNPHLYLLPGYEDEVLINRLKRGQR